MLPHSKIRCLSKSLPELTVGLQTLDRRSPFLFGICVQTVDAVSDNLCVRRRGRKDDDYAMLHVQDCFQTTLARCQRMILVDRVEPDRHGAQELPLNGGGPGS